MFFSLYIVASIFRAKIYITEERLVLIMYFIGEEHK